MLLYRFPLSVWLVLVSLTLLYGDLCAPQEAAAQGPQSDHATGFPRRLTAEAAPRSPVRGAFFVQPDIKTGSAAIAVDHQGGMHLAYDYYVPELPHAGETPAARPAAVYLYCANQGNACADPAHWHGVAMADRVNEVQLALTPAGDPRLLIRLSSTPGSTENDYYYAACNRQCTRPTQWTLTYLGTITPPLQLFDLTTPQRSFALDTQGRPRFVYLDDTPGSRGTFYASCDARCTDATFWFATKIDRGDDPWYESYQYPALAFTAQDQPRVVADGIYLLQGAPLGIYYLACDVHCHDRANWAHVYLFDRGFEQHVSWDLEIAGGQPRLAFYEGSRLNGGGNILYYAWCNDRCLRTAGWQRHTLGLGALHGKHPDLELDGQGRPRLAYLLHDGQGIGYAWCTRHCESARGQWHQRVVETSTKLARQYPIARPLICDAGLWESLAPTLALDRAGNPRLAYDAAYHTRCLYDHDPDDNIPPVQEFWQLWHAVRVRYFPHK